MRVLDDARTWLFPLYASSLTPAWLRLLGARIGKDVEASTVLMIPSLTQVNDQAFLADDTLIGGYELGGGWLRVERVKIGKRAFVGNSGMAAPGRKVPKASLVAVLSAAPRRKTAHAGESWLGSPPAPLRRTAERQRRRPHLRPADPAQGRPRAGRGVPDRARSRSAPGWPWWSRSCWPRCSTGRTACCSRCVLAGAAAGRRRRWSRRWSRSPPSGCWSAGSGPASTRCGARSCGATSWPTPSSRWWPRRGSPRAVAGTPLLNVWLRLLGARIGRGVWCETYWLPETDLVELGDGATVNQGSVVQTHLFHDRMLSAWTGSSCKRGATLGPNSVILPAATLGRHATVGPVSLVMRGESVPDKTVLDRQPDRSVGGPPSEAAAPLRPADRRPVPPRPRRPRRSSAAHYELDLDYDLVGNRLRGEAVIDAVARRGPRPGRRSTSPASTSPR